MLLDAIAQWLIDNDVMATVMSDFIHSGRYIILDHSLYLLINGDYLIITSSDLLRRQMLSGLVTYDVLINHWNNICRVYIDGPLPVRFNIFNLNDPAAFESLLQAIEILGAV